MAAAAGDRCAHGGGLVGSASGGIPPETLEYINKVVAPTTKIALCSIGQFAMHLLAYGLLIGALGAGVAAAGGAFGNIDTVYRVLAGGGALVVCGAGGFVTKFILPDLSSNLDLMIEEEQEKLEDALPKNKVKSDSEADVDFAQGDCGIEGGFRDR